MNGRYVIHIGTHKTGTTSLQSFLAANRVALLERGIDFPVIGRTRAGAQAHRHFAAFFRKQANEHPEGFAQVLSQGFSDAPLCILSSEDFYYMRTDRQVRTLAQALGGPARVICVLREPVSHVMSMYKEALKGGATAALPEFIEALARGLREQVAFSYYSYSANLDRWRQFHDVTVLAYRGSGLVEAVLDAAGIDLPPWQSVSPPRENASFTDEVALYRLAINRLIAEKPERQAGLQALHGLLQGLADAGAVPGIAGNCRKTGIDMAGFIGGFQAANPEFGHLADTAPRSLTFYDTQALDHHGLAARLVEAADAFAGERTARKAVEGLLETG